MVLSGCKDAKDINEKIILTAVALDKKEDTIYLYVEFANIEGASKGEGQSGGAGKKYIYVKSKGKTIPEARENLDRQLAKQPYLSAIRTLILTEDFAKEYLVEYLYRVRADELYRKKTITVVTKENPQELFKISNEKDVSVGFSVEEMLKTLEETGESFTRSTTQLIENLSSSYSGFLIHCIGLQDKEPSLIGYSVVKDTTINGFIPVENSKGVVFLMADNPQFYYVVPYRDNNFTIETSLKKREIKPSYENKRIRFYIKFDFDAKLMYGNQKTPYNFDEATNAEVTKILTEILEKEINHAVEQAQKDFNSDYLQLKDEFRIKFPEAYEKMDWEKEFSRASVDIEVKVVLKGTWMMDYETNVSK